MDNVYSIELNPSPKGNSTWCSGLVASTQDIVTADPPPRWPHIRHGVPPLGVESDSAARRRCRRFRPGSVLGRVALGSFSPWVENWRNRPLGPVSASSWRRGDTAGLAGYQHGGRWCLCDSAYGHRGSGGTDPLRENLGSPGPSFQQLLGMSIICKSDSSSEVLVDQWGSADGNPGSPSMLVAFLRPVYWRIASTPLFLMRVVAVSKSFVRGVAAVMVGTT